MNIGIVGLGLIGGSLAKAAKQRTAHTVYGCDRQESTYLAARMVGAVDGALEAETLPQCDMVFLALYPGETVRYLTEHGPEFSAHTIVLDCCGVKQSVCRAAFPLARRYGFTFVGAHPMAGRAAFGFSAARDTLFHNASMILCPPPGLELTVLERIRELCLELGFSRTPVISPGEHDRRIAYTSQLAHVVSSAYIRSDTARDFRGFSAGSFRDMTRVAELNPDMWTELFFDNKEALAAEIDGLCERLAEYSAALRAEDAAGMKRLLELGIAAKRDSEEKEKSR